MSEYSRGSEWRRWDLHIHTPETKKNDQFKGKNLEEKWDNFYKSINEYIGDGTDLLKNIAVIGITDYCSIDNYKKIITERDRLPKSIKLVLPNVELRIRPIAKDCAINIHCIFSPSIVDSLESRFFSKLFFDDGVRKYNCCKYDLIEFGNKILKNNKENNIDEELAIKRAIERFVIDIGDLKKIFEEDPDLKKKTLIAVSNNSNDGVSGLKEHSEFILENGENQLDETRNMIYRFSDLIFSPKDKDFKFFLGKKTDKIEDFIQKYGSLKPCIHGSDAHTNDRLFRPESDRFCWIKADPTFNGFLQILYEPEARVRISPFKPEEKKSYQVIDYVKIDDKNFSDKPIYFNDSLTCIIGGKSTGKSILLNNIANAIDSKQVTDKNNKVGVNFFKIGKVTVHWKDEELFKKNNKGDVLDINNAHKIVYIPQKYLNNLTDNQETNTEIDKIISDVLFAKEDKKKKYERFQEDINIHKINIDKIIYNTTILLEQIENKKESLKEYGIKENIEKQIKLFEDKKNILALNIKTSKEDIDLYNQSKVMKKGYENYITQINTNIDIISKIESIVEVNIPNYTFLQDVKRKIDETLKSIVDKADEIWKEEKQNIIDNLLKEKKELINKIEECNKIIAKIEPTIKEQESLNYILNQLQVEQNKLKKYEDLEKELIELKNILSNNIEILSKDFFIFKSLHEKYGNDINTESLVKTNGLEFIVKTSLKLELFKDSLLRICDKKYLNSNKSIINVDELTSDWFNENNIKKLLEVTFDRTLRLVKNNTIETALKLYISDWYNTNYDVKMENDSISEMSPGKKSLVLLKMLIELADSECPILIDQPEDDLDNRSIFEELIKFLREKKLNRQIIIVTHNANIVLGGDAEEVIVANQNGAKTQNSEYRFEYYSGSIEDDLPEDINSKGILEKCGIQQHICDILEGGQKAFDLRKNKYRIK